MTITTIAPMSSRLASALSNIAPLSPRLAPDLSTSVARPPITKPSVAKPSVATDTFESATSAASASVDPSNPWLRKLATSRLASGPTGSCVATTLGNMDRLGISSFQGGTTADPNNARGAMVQMLRAGEWSSLPLEGAQRRTIKSAYGRADAYVLNADRYEEMAMRGQIPSGAVLFQTRHGWDSQRGPYGNDMGIVRNGGRVTHNYRSMNPIIYSDAKEVVVLVPKSALGN